MSTASAVTTSMVDDGADDADELWCVRRIVWSGTRDLVREWAEIRDGEGAEKQEDWGSTAEFVAGKMKEDDVAVE